MRATREGERVPSVISGPIVLASLAGPDKVPDNSHGYYSLMVRLITELYFIHPCLCFG